MNPMDNLFIIARNRKMHYIILPTDYFKHFAEKIERKGKMKRRILFMISIIAVAALILAACGGSGNDKLPVSDTEYADYVGTQFSGQDPWGGNLTITVLSIVNGEMDWTFTDAFEDHTLYQEQSKTQIQDGNAEYSLQGKDAENESVSFSYQGTMELRDGQITFRFLTGSVTTSSAEGDSDARIAEALEDSGISNKTTNQVADKVLAIKNGTVTADMITDNGIIIKKGKKVFHRVVTE